MENNNPSKWEGEILALKDIAHQCGLKEEIKWNCPCFTHEGHNIVIIHGFKNYCALSFFKGALLSDPQRILIQPTENMNAGRQIRFENIESIYIQTKILTQYILEAISIENQGLKIESKAVESYPFPKELQEAFLKDKEYENAFYKLTKGRQKGYLLHFSQPKQAQTIVSRIANKRNRIVEGYGIQDCTCGRSKRLPLCDGSHKEMNP